MHFSFVNSPAWDEPKAVSAGPHRVEARTVTPWLITPPDIGYSRRKLPDPRNMLSMTPEKD
jgi:hypothetical protein